MEEKYGEQIKEYRIKLGLTQSQVADAMEGSHSSSCLCHYGKRSILRASINCKAEAGYS